MQAFGKTISPLAMMNCSDSVDTLCSMRWASSAEPALGVVFGGAPRPVGRDTM